MGINLLVGSSNSVGKIHRTVFTNWMLLELVDARLDHVSLAGAVYERGVFLLHDDALGGA